MRPIASDSFVPDCAAAEVDVESISTELSLPVFFATTSIGVALLKTFFTASFVAFEASLL
jgi:hypothetical protein